MSLDVQHIDRICLTRLLILVMFTHLHVYVLVDSVNSGSLISGLHSLGLDLSMKGRVSTLARSYKGLSIPPCLGNLCTVKQPEGL